MAFSKDDDFLSNTPSPALLHRHIPPPPFHPPPPHLILLAYPAQGHIIPLFNLANLLASKGVAITFVCVEHRITRLLHNLSNAAAGRDPPIRLVSLPERVPFGEYSFDEGAGVASWTNEVVAHMEPDFVQLLHDLRSKGTRQEPAMDEFFSKAPIAIVHDSFVYWGVDVASRFNIKAHVFSASNATSVCILLHLPVLISQGYVPLRSVSHDEPRPLITLPGLEPTPDDELLHFFRGTLPTDASIQAALKTAAKLNEASSILINTAYELEASAIEGLKNHHNIHQSSVEFRAIGPVLPLALTDTGKHDTQDLNEAARNYEETECLSWLDSHPRASVVFISFGTIFMPSVEDIRELALGLESSNHAFLWVVRIPSSETSKDENFCVAKMFPKGFLSRTRNRGLILTHWAPQLSILSHPSTGAFLTHCGWNSTIESIFMGVPMIACPQFAEQETNCRLIVRQWKIGIQLKSNSMTVITFCREEVERVVRIAMDHEGEKGKQMRTNARRLKEITRRSLQEGASSSANLQAFVKDLF